jgi:hypothetical protein
LTGGTKKGRSNKSSQMRIVTKDFNGQVVETEIVPKISAEQYTIARRKVIYLPAADYLSLNEAWITSKELQNTILFPELLAVDTTGGTNIEDSTSTK